VIAAQRSLCVTARPSREQTALHLAAEAGRLQIATELLSRGADVNARNKNNQTALHYAAREGALAPLRLAPCRRRLRPNSTCCRPHCCSPSCRLTQPAPHQRSKPLLGRIKKVSYLLMISAAGYEKVVAFLLQNGAVPPRPPRPDLPAVP